MKYLWSYLEKKEWYSAAKYRAAYLILGVICALAGLAAWLIIRIWTLSSWPWMICFVGYPVLISFFAVFFYSCKHDFHNGSLG